MGHRRQHEERDEQADAAVGDHRAGQDHRQHGAVRAQSLGHEAGDRLHGAAVVHELSEQRPEQEQWKELGQETRGTAHERLGPVREQGLACGGGGNEGRQRARAGARSSRERRARSAVRGRRGSRGDPSLSTPPAARRDRRSSAGRGRPRARQGMRRPLVVPPRAACTGMPARRSASTSSRARSSSRS